MNLKKIKKVLKLYTSWLFFFFTVHVTSLDNNEDTLNVDLLIFVVM